MIDRNRVASLSDGLTSGAPCQHCGSFPTAFASFTVGTGLVLWRRKRVYSGRLCRCCGEATYRTCQNATLGTGWWGAISFISNLSYVASNYGGHRQFARLQPPMAGNHYRC